MPFFVQYDAVSGAITGSISGANAPNHASQLEFADSVTIIGKKVDLQTLTLVDADSNLTAEQIVRMAVERAAEFGKSMIIDYSVKNVLRGYTTAQVGEVATALSNITMLLQSGALYTAKEAIDNFTPTSLITSEDKQEFSDKLADYLAS